MRTIPRRDKFKIYGDLLSALYYRSSAEKIVLTQIQAKINVPFDRLKTYITEIKELDLIQDETSLKLTEKGIQYVRMYNKILDFMKRMGLAYP
jgi:predicted transcriptional regulator